MSYITVEELSEHFLEAQAIDDDQLQDYIDQEEAYLKMRLDRDPLPPGNQVLFAILRDLAIARAMISITQVGSDGYQLAVTVRDEAKTRIDEIMKYGLIPTSWSQRQPDNEVYTPYENPFFDRTNFWLE